MLTPRLTATALGLAAAIGLSASPALAGGPIIGFPPFGITVSGCGEVVFDEVCTQLFRFDDGSHYIFNGLDDFAIGDRLFVSGEACLICLLTPCGTPYSAMLDATIKPCFRAVELPTSVPFQGCLDVVLHVECGLLLQSESGQLFSAEGFVEPEQVGLRFFGDGAYSPFTLGTCLADSSTSFSFFTTLSLSGCLGDLNIDGQVDGIDLAELLAAWGPCLDDPIDCFGDLNGDHSVNGQDLALLLGEWTLPRF